MRVRAGATLTELNQALEKKGKALANLTGYSGLTVGGVLSTAAHGSGASLGPLCDLVVSVTLRDAARKLHRVELAGAALTDAQRWAKKHPGGSVFTDPDTFYSVVVGIGCMGVLEDVVLRAVAGWAALWGPCREECRVYEELLGLCADDVTVVRRGLRGLGRALRACHD